LTNTYDEVTVVLSTPTSNRAAQYCFWSDKITAGWKTVMFGGFFLATSQANYAGNTTTTTSWTTSYAGEYGQMRTVNQVTPNILSPATAPVAVQYAIFSLTITGYQYTPYGPAISTATAAMNPVLRFNLLVHGNWFKPVYTVDHTIAQTAGSGFEWFDHAPEYVAAGKS
jgi:hypothetical protein